MTPMSGPDLRDALRRIGLTQADFAAALSRHAGAASGRTQQVTISRWCREVYPLPGAVALAVRALEALREADPPAYRRLVEGDTETTEEIAK